MKVLPRLLLLITFLFLSPRAGASHLLGADFFYTYLGDTTYRITLVMYGDCSGQSFGFFPASTPIVELMNGNNAITTLQLQNISNPLTGVEVTPVCPAELPNTQCNNPTGSLPGVKKFTYTALTTISTASANWRFVFQGNMGNSQAGRSNAITNINAQGGSLMHLEVVLNNTMGPNSSPLFTAVPTPFFCLNLPQQYNPGPVDPDLDSLAFTLGPALTGNQGGLTQPATYNLGYSPANPLLASSMTFNSLNGQLSFTPNAVQQNVVVNNVLEYRNGVIVGSAMREMTFIVVSTCNNPAPSGYIDAGSNVSGGVIAPGNIVNVCQGQPTVAFTIHPSDPANETFNVTVSGLMTGATANITGNNTPSPAVAFSWNTANVAPGNYTFFLTYKDNGCPFTASQTQAYTVRIIRKPSMTFAVTEPTHCLYKAVLAYTLSDGLPPYNLVVKQGNTTVTTQNNISGMTVTDSLYPGTYTATITSPSILCSGTYTFTIVDSGSFPFPPAPDTGFYCLNDQASILTATAYPGASIKWYTNSGTPLPSAPLPVTNVGGQFTWLVDQTYKVCKSSQVTARVYVTPRPTATFTLPDFVCAGDTATALFTGAVGVGPIIAYNWDHANAKIISGSGPGPFLLRWDTAGPRIVKLQVAENKCPSTEVTRNILVKPMPKAQFTAGDICKDAPLRVQYNTAPLAGTSYVWDFDGATPAGGTSIGPFFPVWTTAGPRNVSLQVSLDGCADTLVYPLEVLPRPMAIPPVIDKTPCLGDKIYLQAPLPELQAAWSPAQRIFKEPDGRIYTRAMVAPITYKLVVKNQFDCQDSADFTLLSIGQCCQLSYPNAFSPNGDGLNDRFRVITYGNMDKFELAIYNRWGGQVYHSFIQNESWDGMLNGVPAEAGTYMYYVKAHCLTGASQEHKGEIFLLR